MDGTHESDMLLNLKLLILGSLELLEDWKKIIFLLLNGYVEFVIDILIVSSFWMNLDTYFLILSFSDRLNLVKYVWIYSVNVRLLNICMFLLLFSL
jgi:hypothetical protein